MQLKKEILVIFVLFLFGCYSQQAIIFTSSLGFYNIRQNNNVVKIYHHLKNFGIPDSDILLIFGEMQACCEKNPKFGSLSFYDNDYTNIFRDIEVDYYQSQVTDFSIFNLLSLQYPKYTLNKRRLLRKNKKQPLFVYVSGHGGDFYFKIRERMALIDEQFMIAYDHLERKNITDRIAIFSDSCSAITPFETIRSKNTLSFASSSFDEKSLSHGNDKLLYNPKSDDFSFYFDQMLKKTSYWTFEQAKKYMSFDKLQVNSKIVTTGLSPKTSLDDFIRKKKKKMQKNKFKNNIKFDDIFN